MGHPKTKQPEPGDRYGRLAVLAPAEPACGGKSRFLCACDCGASKVVRASVLVKGSAKSCGCLARELTSSRNKTHGRTYSPEWAAWRRMINRCQATTPDKAAHYRAKGVRVCDQWQNNFEAFLEDMGHMPDDRRTLDRIDNNKGYEPGNCRWATITEQNRNKTSNVKITHAGRTMTVAEWARERGMSQSGLHDRLKHMTVAEALTLPDQRGFRRWRKAA